MGGNRKCIEQSIRFQSKASFTLGSLKIIGRGVMNIRWTGCFFGAWVVFLCFLGRDVEAKARPNPVYPRHTLVDFSDDTIEGDLTKPDAQYLVRRKRLRHERLIKVRQSFRREVLQAERLL